MSGIQEILKKEKMNIETSVLEKILESNKAFFFKKKIVIKNNF